MSNPTSLIHKGLVLEDGREQPWKKFWPPVAEGMSEEELAKCPWLTWSPEPDKPDGKPWYDWMRQEFDTQTPGVVCRRGAG